MYHRIEIRRRPRGRFRCGSMHPRLAQIYAARDVHSEDDVSYRLQDLIQPDTLPGVEDAVDILVRSLQAGSAILFVGDFDADGATSIAVGVNALTAMGAGRVDYLVPNRFQHGYGLSPAIVEIARRRDPALLITVDNGIASMDGVDAARHSGMSVIVTDHHLPGDRLPRADAIVNPNLDGSSFRSSALAGVGVIFYLMVALRSRLREMGWFHAGFPQPNLGELLDLVAIGTVADLVPLDKNNRILVAKGLEGINVGRCRPGVAALLGYCNRRIGELSTSDLAYAVAPRLNAAGRLEDMSLGIECLLAGDPSRAAATAADLDRLNGERREIESEMKQQAISIVNDMHLSGTTRRGLCLYEETWHQGIVGLVAGRIKDRTAKPVVAFAQSETDELKGSARSIPGLHIRDVLCGIATREPDLIVRFGGHAAAAGLTLKKKNLERFEDAFSAEVEARSSEDAEGEIVYSDGNLSDNELCAEFAALLRRSGPWGQEFPEPVFDDVFDVLDSRTVGNGHLKLRVRKKNCSRIIDAIAFYYDGPIETAEMGMGVHLVYKLDVNEYRGVRSPQLLIQHLLRPRC